MFVLAWRYTTNDYMILSGIEDEVYDERMHVLIIKYSYNLIISAWCYEKYQRKNLQETH